MRALTLVAERNALDDRVVIVGNRVVVRLAVRIHRARVFLRNELSRYFAKGRRDN